MMVFASLAAAPPAHAQPSDGGVGADAQTSVGADAQAAPAADTGTNTTAVPPAPSPTHAPADAGPEAATTPAPPPTQRLDTLTVVGTRESRTAGSAHVLRPRDLERMDYDNPETVVKSVPGVYARGEDGFGLRPNIGIRGTSPDRSKKITLMEDGLLFAPAPYAAPAAYYFPLMTRMDLVRVIKGPGSVSFGPQTVGGAIDLVTRAIPADEAGAIDLAGGTFGYGKAHGWFGASTARAGYVLEGVLMRSTGFKELDGGGDTGFEKSEFMWKGRYILSTDPNATQQVGLKLGYADEDSRESYLGLSDADFRANPYRRYRASRFDRMQWHRTQAAATYHATFARAFTLDAAVYRNDFSRTWRKVNRMGAGPILPILENPDDPMNAGLYGVLTGALDWSNGQETIFIGPNRRQFVSQGVQVVGGWQGATGLVTHRLEAGVRLHHDSIDRLHTEEGFRMIDGNLVHDGGPTDTTSNGRNWANALALHLTDAATVGRFTFTPGVRAELIETHVRDRLTGVDVWGTPQRVVIPGLGVYAALTDSLGLLAGVHRGFSPAAPDVPGGARPETSVNYEAGARLSRPRLRLEAIGFFNDYQNLTSNCTVQSGCLPSMLDRQTNAGRVHIWGGELFTRAEAVVRPGYVVPLMAAYTYTRTELLEMVTSADPTLGTVMPGYELPYVPRHEGTATVAFETPRGSLAVAGSYISAMRERAGAGPIPPQGGTDPSFILDTMARVNVTSRGHLYLSVRNLLGADDVAARLPFGARPVAPRWIQLGTKWSF
jgi:Fe(3+) dicitrate transport protein